MKRLIATAILAIPLWCMAQDTDRLITLTESVAAANQNLQSHDYSNAVRRLFALTEEAEVATAAMHLQRPACLTMYEQLFAQLVNIEPTLHPLSNDSAVYKCRSPIIIGTNSWDSIDNMEVMFIFNGSKWVFHDPSFERRLGRKITSRE